MKKCNYYFSSFFWSTIAKCLNAVFVFISVPFILEYYGKTNYGILSIALAINGCMNLFDLGLNVGTLKYFSQWRKENKIVLINRVACTNITFYVLVSILNSVLLIILYFYGYSFFDISFEQFNQLRIYLIILASFSILSWSETTFNQLLISDNKMAFTMQVKCVVVVLKLLLFYIIIKSEVSLSIYFLFFVLISSLSVFPYAFKCLKDGLLDKIRLGFNWDEYKIVLTFSLSIFALSMFQVISIQSRPIILSVFSDNAADIVAEFRILEVFPMFIIAIGGAFSPIFLPKSSLIIASNSQYELEFFAYKWTTITSILSNILCVPLILSSKEILSVYVGEEYSSLSIWLIIWCCTILIQIHTTPGYSLVLALGKTRQLMILTAISCCISIAINIVLCEFYGVGSAIIGYFVYVLIIISSYYLFYYNRLLHLNGRKMFLCFIKPTVISFLLLWGCSFISIDTCPVWMGAKYNFVLIAVVKSLIWIMLYILVLFCFNIISLKYFKDV